MMTERFISQSLVPVQNEVHTLGMASGEPGLPQAFKWGKKRIDVKQVLNRWKGTSSCSHGGSERYVRKHWFEIETGQGQRMKIYFERQTRRGASQKLRWWLYNLEENQPST